MWAEPEPTDAERRERHYNALASEMDAITITNLPCPTCGPEEGGGYGEVRDCLTWGGAAGGRFIGPVVLMSTSPDTEEGYLTGLHELGHVATGFFVRGRRANRWPIRRYEAEAWLWALDRALIEPSPQAWRWITRSLETYIAGTKTDPTFDRLLLEATKKGSE